MNQLMKRVLSVLLVVCLLCSALPSAFAAEGGGFTEDNGTTQEDTCTPAGMRSTASGITSTQHPTREHLAQCLRTPQHRMDIR